MTKPKAINRKKLVAFVLSIIAKEVDPMLNEKLPGDNAHIFATIYEHYFMDPGESRGFFIEIKGMHPSYTRKIERCGYMGKKYKYIHYGSCDVYALYCRKSNTFYYNLRFRALTLIILIVN